MGVVLWIYKYNPNKQSKHNGEHAVHQVGWSNIFCKTYTVYNSVSTWRHVHKADKNWYNVVKDTVYQL